MKTKNILIAGVGNLGYWYFYALKNLKFDLKIYIYDIRKISIDIFKKKIEGLKCNNIIIIEKLNKLPKNLHLAIISSYSKNRFILIKSILRYSITENFIIEKIVEQSVQNLKKMQILLKNINSYVSFTRRKSTIYKNFKKKKLKKIILNVQNDNWGMASNGIHYLDLISWLSNKKIKNIDINDLDYWYPGKRKGFYEVNGKLSFYFGKNFSAHLTSKKNIKRPKVELISRKNRWELKKYETVLIKNNKNIYKLKKSLAISEVMKTEIKNILDKKKTDLPKFKDIVYNHCVYISALLLHWNKYHKKNTKILPIT